MAKIEGVRRIMLTGKVIVLVGATLAVLAWLMLYGLSGGIGGLAMLLVLLIYPGVLGGLVWTAGWIVQGFLEPDA